MPTRRIRLLAVLLACTVPMAAWAVTMMQTEGAKPLTEGEIIQLLQGGSTGAQVAEMVKARGINFSPSEVFVQNLTTLKVDPVLLETIRTPARVTFRTGFEGVNVVVDGEDKGATGPGGALAVEGIPGGTHVARLTSPQHVGQTVDFFVRPAETRPVEVKLVSAIATTAGPFGLNVTIAGGTAADAAMRPYYSASTPEEKINVLNAVLGDYRETPVALLAYDLLAKAHLSLQHFDESLAAAQALAGRDPRSVSARITLARAALGKQQIEQALSAAEEASRLISEGQSMAPPSDVDAQAWEMEKVRTQPQVNSELPSLQYALFTSLYRMQPATARAEALDRYLAAFPESPYTVGALGGLALAYQELQDPAKMLESADKALALNPNEPNMLMIVSDYLSDQNQQLERAQELAALLLDLVTNQVEKIRSAGLSDEQWAGQQQFYSGLAHTALGMVQFQKGSFNEAIQEFEAAQSGLASQPFYATRNKFRNGVAYARIGGRGNLQKAKELLTEVVAAGPPFAAPAQDMLNRVNQALGGR